jgi:glycosyltransferase involved in cell wall biosynthesis
MIFKFLTYVSPVWYFNLKPKINHCYFPSKKWLEENKFDLQIDLNYKSQVARNRDLGYRAFQMGYIDKNGGADTSNSIWEKEAIPVEDEYRFIRKNFNKAWVWYILIIRLVLLKNPIREFFAIYKSRTAKREKYHEKAFNYKDYELFESDLVKENPLISVIIPTLNRYNYLKDVFRDLEKQTYKHFEVIVVDQTDAFDKTVYEGWSLNLRYWFQEEKALWKARNDAIKVANGSLILLYDDDSLVEPDWIEQHIKTIDFFKADLSSGVSISTVGAKVPAHYRYFRWSDQLDTGNVLLKKDIFKTIGLFDTKFEKQRMGDGEFGLRAYLAGYRNISNPLAKRIHLKVGEGGLRQMGSWDGWRPKKFFGPRPVPSILYFYRKYFGNVAARWLMLATIPLSIVPYKFKGNKALSIIGIFITILIFPLVLWQFWLSWKKASEMFK